MAHFWQNLRDGTWLTRERIRAYALIVLGLWLAGGAIWLARSPGLIDPNGKPIGTDFSSFYAAGSLALEGRATAAYDMAQHHTRQKQMFGAGTLYYGWLYPPIFLLVAAPLALMPYPLALAVWQGGTLLAFLAAVGAIAGGLRQPAAGRLWLLVALAFPAVFVNLGHGQNGLLTASLFGAALVALPARPAVAGVLFGLLAYKPQFGLVVPVALLTAGQWRTIATAVLTVIALAALATLLFGAGIWPAFIASTGIARTVLLEQGDVGFEKLSSAFAAVRIWGGGVALAYAIQMATTLAAIVVTALIWRARLDHAQKAAALSLAALLASPHVLDYDLTLLGITIAYIAVSGFTRGFRDGEITLLAVAWITPLVARGIAGASGVPLGFIVQIALLALLLGRARADAASVSAQSRSVAQA
jgi:hypothetical protein